ncbi:MAG: hypothetical protein KIT56_09040 [Gammaproteobacteria bacterium]|nr:hypothetical protein [Gammaproteobacteria bacterium]MCW5584001.1 hypothetical protein [Gammaproteobacteria bacterium]
MEYDAEKIAVLHKWASYKLSNEFRLPINLLAINMGKHNQYPLKMRINTFSSSIKFVSDPILVSHTGSTVVLLGDASMSPYYWEGISSTIGLNGAINYVKCLLQEEKMSAHERFRKIYYEYVDYITDCLNQLNLDPVSEKKEDLRSLVVVNQT